jgi:hypothetical protein
MSWNIVENSPFRTADSWSTVASMLKDDKTNDVSFYILRKTASLRLALYDTAVAIQ